MGIYIKGMEMPTEEYGSMTITIYPNGSVMEYIGDIGRSLGYAVPVPPHGRLIDADALPLEESVPTVMMHDGEWWISAYELAMAPIVIPADPPKAEA